jgi:hypothetical protein
MTLKLEAIARAFDPHAADAKALSALDFALALADDLTPDADFEPWLGWSNGIGRGADPIRWTDRKTYSARHCEDREAEADDENSDPEAFLNRRFNDVWREYEDTLAAQEALEAVQAIIARRRKPRLVLVEGGR